MKPRQAPTLLAPEPVATQRPRRIDPAWKPWYPEPQERWVQPPLPGKRDDGTLWFEGSPKIKPVSIETPKTDQRWKSLPDMSPGPRDYRKGDRWLDFHFNEDGTPK